MTANELLENYEKLVKFIEDSFEGERKEKLMWLYENLSDRIATAPASMKKQYHNAYPGGYVAHVLNVIKAAEKVYKVWEEMGAEFNFTITELRFAALNHDLGKIGTKTEEYYIPCQEEWMRKKGQEYVMNPNIQYMKVAERSLMMLQQSQISVTENEYLAIKLHDGLYEDANKAYYISYSEDMQLKTTLPYILHQADLMCAKIEGQTNSPKQVKVAAAKTGNKTLDKFLNE
jgi:hypothetical protein